MVASHSRQRWTSNSHAMGFSIAYDTARSPQFVDLCASMLLVVSGSGWRSFQLVGY